MNKVVLNLLIIYYLLIYNIAHSLSETMMPRSNCMNN
ncbi:BgTH12-02584 [Blumeria graminis f. sp. triticale]|uniref:Bgt-50272 n=2 Tax=Blumeria graminis TaxID=34373 RepID=A0A9X9MI03_BLUGR|nr:BgTH12-02584 [Blumeria graminis f. sp. triticale]VDB88727.1 Bgt-50272 [Blumeria graminis f. sp. tritici]